MVDKAIIYVRGFGINDTNNLIKKEGSSGENMLYLYPNQLLVKDFLTRTSIDDEIAVLELLEGNLKYYQMLGYINDPKTKLIAYEWVNPILLDKDDIEKLGKNIPYLNQVIENILENIIILAKNNWVHNDVGLGNIGWKKYNNAYRFVLYDYEDSKKIVDQNVLKNQVLQNIDDFLDDIIIQLKKHKYDSHVIYVQKLKDYFQKYLSVDEITERPTFRKTIKRMVVVKKATFDNFDQILDIFHDFANHYTI
jgi:hypothetical protein